MCENGASIFRTPRGVYCVHLPLPTQSTLHLKRPVYAAHSLVHLLPSGRRYGSLQARTTRMANSLSPQAVRLLKNTVPLSTHLNLDSLCTTLQQWHDFALLQQTQQYTSLLVITVSIHVFLVNVVLSCVHTGLLLITLDLIMFTFDVFAL